MYVYLSMPDKDGKCWLDGVCGLFGGAVSTEDFVEIMFRIAERSDIPFGLKEVNDVRNELCLNPLEKIISLEEYNKNYECPGCRVCKEAEKILKRRKKK